MSTVYYHRLKTILAGILGLVLLITLGPVCNTEVNAKDKTNTFRVETLPPLTNSFVVREGTASDITCLALGKRKEVYAAGVSDKNSVIFKLDKKLRTIKEMVKFGSPKVKTASRIWPLTAGEIFLFADIPRKKIFP